MFLRAHTGSFAADLTTGTDSCFRPGVSTLHGRRGVPAKGIRCSVLLWTALCLVGVAGTVGAQSTSTGLIPISDLIAGAFQGYAGGLYPSGNSRPAAHEAAGQAHAAAVVPLNTAGSPDPNGRIVLVSIGMSNTRLEFASFINVANSAGVNPRLALVNGAKSGSPSKIIAHPEKTEGLRYWTDIDATLAAAGLSPAQVQVAWVKVAEANPSGLFPEDALRFKADLKLIAKILKQRFPNIRLAYFSSRVYAGYADVLLSPEPYAYQSGFGVKWLIEDQIKGDLELNYDPSRGAVNAPWLAWGPYMWADGLRARSDGLIWRREDFSADGTHPSEAGSLKIAGLLLSFFREDSTTQRWFGAGASLSAPTNLRIVR
jgi:hypothetical protein